jgi:hypothetical protein
MTEEPLLPVLLCSCLFCIIDHRVLGPEEGTTSLLARGLGTATWPGGSACAKRTIEMEGVERGRGWGVGGVRSISACASAKVRSTQPRLSLCLARYMYIRSFHVSTEYFVH